MRIHTYTCTRTCNATGDRGFIVVIVHGLACNELAYKKIFKISSIVILQSKCSSEQTLQNRAYTYTYIYTYTYTCMYIYKYTYVYIYYLTASLWESDDHRSSILARSLEARVDRVAADDVDTCKARITYLCIYEREIERGEERDTERQREKESARGREIHEYAI